MTRPETPKAFFSYVRQVDDHDGGRLTRLRERLQGEIRVQTGIGIELFQDIRDVKWGDRWQQRILDAAAGSLFLIPVVTPGYFLSDPCRSEYEAFKALEQQHAIQGVILPIYYVETDELSDPAWREGNAWAEELAAMQWVDWRTLRLEPWESPEPNRRVEQMAKALKQRLKELGFVGLRQTTGTAPNGATVRSKKNSNLAAESASNDTQGGPLSLPSRREIIIEPSGRGHFRTISDAIKVAGADDVLLIRPGTYRESVTIEKSLTLVGDGSRDEVVIEAASGSAISFNAPFGRVVNLTIRRLKGEKVDYCVWIRAGRPELEGCDISSSSLACVAVSGDADPTIRRNRIHDGQSAGILVYQKARGLIEDNDIFASVHANVGIKDEADPTIRRNRIHNCQESGVLIYEKGRGTLEDNDIFENTKTGVMVQDSGSPTVRSNRIRKNKYEAVWVRTNGAGTFEDNDLRDNVRGPWDIASECLSNIKRSGNVEK